MSPVPAKEKAKIVTRSFRFDVEEGTAPAPKRQVVIEINDEKFELANNLEGFELLQYTATSNTLPGIVRLMERVVADGDDWTRFLKCVRKCQTKDFVKMANDVLDAYAAFPTSQEDSSSDG